MKIMCSQIIRILDVKKYLQMQNHKIKKLISMEKSVRRPAKIVVRCNYRCIE